MISAHQRSRVRVVMLLAMLLLLAVFVTSVATGHAALTPAQLLRTLAGEGTPRENLILFDFRLPRILIATLAGMGLAVAGAILQSTTRNPLADPGILGINAGAGVMVMLYLLFFPAVAGHQLYVLPVFALLGGLMTAGLIYLLSWSREEGLHPTRLVLVGVGLAAGFTGMIITLASRFTPEQYDVVANWMAGRIWGDDWLFVLALFPWLLLLIPLVCWKANELNLLHLQPQVAAGLGVQVTRERMKLMIIAVALASASVSVSGVIAFVGLLAPHIARSLIGPRHQSLLPLTAMLGAILLLAADTIGRVILDPSGIPAGVIVSVLGAPYFLYLMAKK